MTLSEIFWRRVRSTLASQGRSEAYLREQVPRNKNTYTNWFLHGRINKIKDLEDIAEALGVSVSVLLSPDGEATRTVDQFRLQFDPGSTRAILEIECDETGMTVRPHTSRHTS